MPVVMEVAVAITLGLVDDGTVAAVKGAPEVTVDVGVTAVPLVTVLVLITVGGDNVVSI